MTSAHCNNLCGACKGIDFDALGDFYSYAHYPKVELLRLEAQRENGCRLCALLWWSLRRDHHSIDDDLTVRLYSNLPPSLCSEQLQQLDVIVASAKKVASFGWARGRIGQPWQVGPPDYLLRGHLTLYGIHGNSANQFFKHKLISINPDSDDCFHLVQRWLQECLENHAGVCSRSTGTFFPTRVIDVGPGDGSEAPRLWISDPDSPDFEDKRYVALSYCRGERPFLTTTSSNLKTLELSIPLDRLPRTVQDAIVIVRKLGIRYLWLDALCIIQGSDANAQQDWTQESAKMNMIYREAVLTITAAGASDAHQGIFHQRQKVMPHCVLDHPSSGTLTGGAVSIGPGPDSYHKHAEPLNCRAWTLQERLLSTRVLEYGTTELSWTYRSGTFAESEDRPHSDTAVQANAASPGKSHYTALLRQEAQSLCAPLKSIVEDYSTRDLTRASDKLPALAGLAGFIHEMTGDKYLAGLWQSQLLEQLLWKHLGKRVGRQIDYPIPASFRAPSWAWTSVDGKVEFCQERRGHLRRRLSIIRTRIISCEVDSSLPGGLGNVQRGELIILGLVMQVPTIQCKPIGEYYSIYENYAPWRRHPDGLKTYLDSVDKLPKEMKKLDPDAPKELLDTWFLFVRNFPPTGLILREVPSPPSLELLSFERIGLFEGYCVRGYEPERKGFHRRRLRII